MRIGNYVLFEKIPDVERLWEAVLHAEATLDRYRRASYILFNGRIEMLEREVVELKRRCIQEGSCHQLLQACQQLEKRLERLEVFHADT